MRWLMLLTPILLAACAAPSPAPEDHFYRLSVARIDDCQPHMIEGVLRIEEFHSVGLLHDRAIVYTESQAAAEVDRYHYHLWHKSPDNLIRDHLAEYMASYKGHCQVAARVATATSMPADWFLDGTVQSLIQVRNAGEVRVSLVLQLRHRGQDKPLLLHTYRESEQLESDGMAAVIAAFNRALTRIYDRFLADIDRRLTANGTDA